MSRQGNGPFFIVGCGRSGTTLLRTMLDHHPQIGIPQESLFIVDYLKVARERELADLKPLLVREPELGEWGIRVSIEDLEGCRTIAEAIDRLHRIYLEMYAKVRWGQKTPRFIRSVELLLEHFPDSRFIHLVRDPRAVVSSLIASNVHASTAYFGARRWLRDVQIGLAQEVAHPERVLRIRYEDLVTGAEATLRTISGHLKFDYDPAMLSDPTGRAGEYSKFYEAIHANLDLPPTDRFVDRWKGRLTQSQVEVVEGICGSLMKEIGYEPTLAQSTTAQVQPHRMAIGRAWGMVRQSAQYIRFRRQYLFYLLYRKMRLGLLGDFIREVNY